MTTNELIENGAANVLVLHDSQARLETNRLVFSGGGSADVFAEDDQTLVQVETGAPTSAELTRAVVTSSAFTALGDVLDVIVACGQGYDRYVLSGDLKHRWLFTRQWDRRENAGGPTIAVVGHSPFEQETAPSEGARRMLAGLLGLAKVAVGAPAHLHVANVFTRRTADNADITGDQNDRRPDPGVVAEKLGEADAIIAGWGGVPRQGLWAVEETVELLRTCRDGGARILIRSFGGELETSGDPPQPSGQRGIKQGARLVDAPADWLWGGPLQG